MTAALICLFAVLVRVPPFADTNAWKVVNYRDNLKITHDFRTADGQACVQVHGSGGKETAFSLRSPMLRVHPGTKELSVSAEVAATRTLKIGGGTEMSKIWWWGEHGERISNEVIAVVMPTTRQFGRFTDVFRVPEGATRFSLWFGFNYPHLGAHDWVRFRNVRVETSSVIGSFKRGLTVPERPAYRSDAGASKLLREDGVAIVDGKPFFPIGVFGMTTIPFNGNSYDKAFEQLAAVGFNFGHTYNYPAPPAYLEAAERHGCKVCTTAVTPPHPAILAWYLCDDTSDYMQPEELLAAQAEVRSRDPVRLTANADSVEARGLSDYGYTLHSDYVNGSDVFFPEIYPIRGPKGHPSDATCVKKVIRIMDLVRRDRARFGDGTPRAVWPLLQAFMAEGSKSWGHFPSKAQLRAMAFAAIIHGATGILWYDYGRGNPGNQGITSTPERWEAIAGIATRLKSLSPVLTSRTPSAQPTSGCPNVTCLLKRHDGMVYLLAVNSSPDPVSACIRNLPLDKVGEVMWEGRGIVVHGGCLTDGFDGFGVHVYRWKE